MILDQGGRVGARQEPIEIGRQTHLLYIARTPFERSRGFSEWLREDTFRR